MAKIIKKGASLENELSFYKKKIKIRILWVLIIAVISPLTIKAIHMGIQSDISFFYYLPMVFVFAFIITLMALFVSIVPLKKRIDILRSGIEGENAANRCISLLPEAYTVFRNLTISYKGKSSEIDTVIVGPTGVFVVEIKHLNGTVYGNVIDTHLTLHKVGRGGTPYSKMFYNPIKQVNTHVFRFANCLRQNGVHTYVNAAVYFSNLNTFNKVVGTDKKTPIFFAGEDGANKLLNHILKNNQHLSQGECAEIIKFLKKI